VVGVAGAAMKDALRATGRREPGQARKGAALSGKPRAFGLAYLEPKAVTSRPSHAVKPDPRDPSQFCLESRYGALSGSGA